MKTGIAPQGMMTVTEVIGMDTANTETETAMVITKGVEATGGTVGTVEGITTKANPESTDTTMTAGQKGVEGTMKDLLVTRTTAHREINVAGKVVERVGDVTGPQRGGLQHPKDVLH